MLTKTATLLKLAYSDEIKKLMREDPRVRKILAENQISGNLDSFIKKLSGLGYKPEMYGFTNKGGRWEVGSSSTSRGSSGKRWRRPEYSSGDAHAEYEKYKARQKQYAQEATRARVNYTNFKKRMARNSRIVNQGFGIWAASSLAAPIIGSLYKSEHNHQRVKNLSPEAKADLKKFYSDAGMEHNLGKATNSNMADYVAGPTTTGALAGGALATIGTIFPIGNLQGKLFTEPSNKANIRKALRLRGLPLVGIPAALGGAYLGQKVTDKKLKDYEQIKPNQEFAKAASINHEQLLEIARQSREQSKKVTNENRLQTAKDVGVGAGALTGLGLINQEAKRGNLTGRETLYHGTNPKNKASILAEGIRPTTDKSAVNTRILKDIFPGVYKDSLGKSYLTRSKLEALNYSASSQVQDNPLSMPKFRDGTVKANVPTWKMQTVRNPETAMGYEAWSKTQDKLLKDKHGIDKVNPLAEKVRRFLYNRMDSAVVLEGGLDSKYLRGGKDYSRLTASELRDFLSKNKGRALKGYGKAGIGLGSAGLGINYFLNKAKNSQQPS